MTWKVDGQYYDADSIRRMNAEIERLRAENAALWERVKRWGTARRSELSSIGEDMKTTDWDTVKGTVGVDATARRVASTGVSYECGIAPTDYWDNPLPLRDEEYYELRATTSQNWVDFRGERFGRLTVIGVVAGKNKSGARWLCKCACGGYVTRTSKTLRIAKNDETTVVGRYGGPSFVDRCGRCDVQEKIRTGDLNPETIDRLAKGARKRFAE